VTRDNNAQRTPPPSLTSVQAYISLALNSKHDGLQATQEDKAGTGYR